MNAKEKWIQDTENSLIGLKPAEVNSYLYSKIITRLTTKVEQAPAKLIWAAAASFIVLVVLNFFIIKSSNSGVNTNKAELQSLKQQFQLMNDNNINYN
ncbi:MAG: hypothetical protein H0U95_17895 [Bacteroidetes bacterium]|nr:hypothetical protein [Bacteroidota bacterium]